MVSTRTVQLGLAEGLRLLAELVVGGGHEVVPGEEGQLALLGECGRLAEGEPRGHSGAGAGGGAEELAALRVPRSGPVHERPPLGGEVWDDSGVRGRWSHPLRQSLDTDIALR